MAQVSVRLGKLGSIADDTDIELHHNHGLERVDLVVPAGFYQRRKPVYVDTADLHPLEWTFSQYTDSLRQDFDTLHRFVVRDALVTDQGALITRGGTLVEESCWEFLAHGHVPFGLQRKDAQTFRQVAQPTEVIETPTLLLKRPWWRNYGHWLIDAASLLALMVRRGVGGFDQIMIGAAEDPEMRKLYRETLACIGVNQPVLEHPDTALWRFAQLHYMQPVRRPPMFTLPQAIGALRATVLGDEQPAAKRRLFVSRRHYDRRRLENEPEIIAICERYGFDTVYPEQLSLRGQAALFNSAAVIAGVKGAGLANLVFVPQGASIIALSPADFPDPFFWDIAGARGLAYAEIFGPLSNNERSQAHNPFEINARRFNGLLQATLPKRFISVSQPHAIAPEPEAPFVTSQSDTSSVFPRALTGKFYQTCLSQIHDRAKPRTYLEIGTLNGESLALSQCRSVAIDPELKITTPLPGSMPSLFLFRGTSDSFFETVSPTAILGGPIDLAFLDGMHLFEFLLRDFVNTERHCHSGSMVVIHDCIPLTLQMTRRNRLETSADPDLRYPGWWTGDVWKTVDILMRHRPDLDVTALDAPPTGLIVIRNLDPASTVLPSQYAAIVDAYRSRPDLPKLEEYFRKLVISSTSMIDSFDPIELPSRARPSSASW